MDDGAESLMTVHLLTHLGHSFPLRQTLDRLLEWLCLDVRLFLVSERIPPLKYYERYRKRSCSFPGISILLFLHEDLGEERIFQVHEQFQRPPWRYQRAQFGDGQSPPFAPSHQDFYGLDEQLPVWGVRRAHRGPEILRVTLYCSFDNYEDAVRLYEMILQKEGTLQKSTLCVFVLHSTPHVAVQLCLKQLPIGVAAEPRDSSALQFRVQEIGQLVPLLPNPCVPISSTRWQTQDYEGNTILLKVQSSCRTLERNIGLSQQRNVTGSGKIPQDCMPAPLPGKQGNPGRRSQEVRALKSKVKPEPGEVAVSERAGGDLRRRSCGARGAAAARPRWEAPSLGRQGARGPRAPLPESRRPRAPETDVDTGLAVGHPGRCPLSRLPGALRSSPRQQPRPGAGSDKAELGAPRASPAHPAPDEEEEFFI
ncbi:protein FAM124B [Parus major]|uniref:protein FAM124B n=1 Tax=Parus major TaxID=9157 RepID=UPI000771145B|nr:protein FAM124B [Parus major]XP_015492507.1 protein FAM124B [Parus major]XP_015492509.1 protein FAM124B [Parus major]XP_033372490.1 protein FAM124B [Parus major]